MIANIHEIDAPPAGNPFQYDKLERKECAVNLTRLIAQSPLTLTINAPWGCGKTTFIKMWQQYLKDEGHCAIYFNAWENDYLDNPLLAVIGALQEEVANIQNPDKSKIDKAYDKVKSNFKKFVKASPKIALNYLLKGGLHYITDEDSDVKDEIKALSEMASQFLVNELDQQATVKQCIKDFRESLSGFAEEVSTDDKPLVVMIDELDRCRPDYAIKLLEAIKHLFSVPGVVFVLAVDRERLGHAAASVIGFNPKDSDGYLRRFVDMDFYLPTVSSEKLLTHWLKSMKIPQMGEYSIINQWLPVLVKILNLSLRTQYQCLMRLATIWKAYPRNPSGRDHWLCLIVFLMSYDHLLVEDVWRKKCHPNKLIKLLEVSDEIRYEDEYLHTVEIISKNIKDIFRDQYEALNSRDVYRSEEIRKYLWGKIQFSLQFSV